MISGNSANLRVFQRRTLSKFQMTAPFQEQKYKNLCRSNPTDITRRHCRHTQILKNSLIVKQWMF